MQDGIKSGAVTLPRAFLGDSEVGSSVDAREFAHTVSPEPLNAPLL